WHARGIPWRGRPLRRGPCEDGYAREADGEGRMNENWPGWQGRTSDVSSVHLGLLKVRPRILAGDRFGASDGGPNNLQIASAAWRRRAGHPARPGEPGAHPERSRKAQRAGQSEAPRRRDRVGSRVAEGARRGGAPQTPAERDHPRERGSEEGGQV